MNVLYKLILIIISFTIIFSISSCGDRENEPDVPEETFIPDGTANGYGYIDLGLSVPWAVSNYGATRPENNGTYTCPFYWKYSQTINSLISGSNQDRARHLMGKQWRLPTEDEIRELWEKCTWKVSSLNGVKGAIVTGPNGKSIFFPFSGWYYFSSIPWSDTEGPYEKYKEDWYGFYGEEGPDRFDLLIPYENTNFRYSRDRDMNIRSQYDVSVSSICPLRAVYSSTNPSINSGSGNTPGGGGDSDDELEIGFYDFSATKSTLKVEYRIYSGNVKSAKVYYGTSSPSRSVSATVNGKMITARISGLKSGTTYYVKCVANGSGGSTTSETTKCITSY